MPGVPKTQICLLIYTYLNDEAVNLQPFYIPAIPV